MISVDTLRRCAWLSGIHLEELLRKRRDERTVLNAEFVGISTGGQFVYNIAYPDNEEIRHTKIFVWQNDRIS